MASGTNLCSERLPQTPCRRQSSVTGFSPVVPVRDRVAQVLVLSTRNRTPASSAACSMVSTTGESGPNVKRAVLLVRLPSAMSPASSTSSKSGIDC